MFAHVEIQHLLTAVIMTAPATIMLAKIIEPETDTPVTAGKVEVKLENTAVNIIDAAAQGAGDGLHLVLNIAAMLIAFLALIAMVNGGFGKVHEWFNWFPATMQQLFGIVFAPIAWILGVPWKDCSAIGQLLGERLVTNEFIAFIDLGKIKSQLDDHILQNCHLRALRFCQLQFHRDSAGRHRRAGAHSQRRSRAARNASRNGRHHGELYVGMHRRQCLI